LFIQDCLSFYPHTVKFIILNVCRVHDLHALEAAGMRAGLSQLQQEGVFLVENCSVESASDVAQDQTDGMTIDIMLPPKALASISPGQRFDVILVASGALLPLTFCVEVHADFVSLPPLQSWVRITLQIEACEFTNAQYMYNNRHMITR
jgi:hypothetical protein